MFCSLNTTHFIVVEPTSNPILKFVSLNNINTPYKLKTEKDIGLNNLLGKADYFYDPSLLVFNTNYDIEPNLEHILDNSENKKGYRKS